MMEHKHTKTVELSEDKKENIVKSMKKKKAEFKDRYGDKWKSVMYATAAKLSKEQAEGKPPRYHQLLNKDNTVKHDKRFKMYRNLKKKVD